MADRIVNIGINKKMGTTTVDHDPVHICKWEGDQVVWRTQKKGGFTIDFGSRSPFRKLKFNGQAGRPAKSGKPVRRSRSGYYKYTVQVHGARAFDPGTGVHP